MLPAETHNKNIWVAHSKNPASCLHYSVGLFLKYTLTECEAGVIQINYKPFESLFMTSSLKNEVAEVFEHVFYSAINTGMWCLWYYHNVFQTVAIKEASLKCKQKQDQLDRKHIEVRLRFSFFSERQHVEKH